MTNQWPTLPVSIAGAILTILSVILLLDLKIEADVYGLLGQEDEAVKIFDQLASQTSGLEEMLIICDQGFVLDRPTLAKVSSIDGVREHTRSFLEATESPVYGFALTVDPSDWHDTQPIILSTRQVLLDSAAPCGLTGTPAVVYEMQSRVDHDLRVAIALLAAISGRNLELLDDNHKLETSGLPSRDLQDRVATEHDLITSPLLLLFANAEDSYELLAAAERPDEINSIMAVTDIDGLLRVHPVSDPFMRAEYDRTLAALDAWISDEGLGEWQISGAPALNARINELLSRDVPTVLPIAALAILLVLVIGTRSLLLPCIILAPLLLALVWMAGIMSFFGVAVSAVTIAIAPLVLGIGVDGGVHFVASWKRHEGNLEEVFAETGLAIIVTVTTSVAAFGTFVVSDSPSLIRFGAQASLALIGCLVITLTVLPAVARRFLPTDRKTGSEQTD